MSSSGPKSQADARASSLPLFRPEALAAQEKSHGEILLVRPFSLILLTWLFVGIAIIGFGFLITGHYDETTHVSASLGTIQHRQTFSREAFFFVPSQWATLLQTGTSVPLQWQSCAGQPTKIRGTVVETAPASSDETASDNVNGNRLVKVTVALSNDFSMLTNREGHLEAEIPVGRKRLIHWFFAANKS